MTLEERKKKYQDVLVKIDRYEDKKNNDILDAFYMSDLYLMRACINEKISKVEEEFKLYGSFCSDEIRDVVRRTECSKEEAIITLKLFDGSIEKAIRHIEDTLI